MSTSTEVADELVDATGNPVVTTTEIVSFKKIEANLIVLESHFKDKTWDMTDAAQKAEAAATSKKFTKLRTALERSRQEEKAESLRIGKLVDGNAATFKGRIVAIESRIDAEIKAEDDRLAAIEAEKIRAEQERVGAIRKRIDAIQLLGVLPFDATSLFITDTLGDVPDFDGSYAEFSAEAEGVINEVRGTLRAALSAAIAREEAAAQAEKLRKENESQAAELAQLRADKAERDAAAAKKVDVPEELPEAVVHVVAETVPQYRSRFLASSEPASENEPVPDDRGLALDFKSDATPADHSAQISGQRFLTGRSPADPLRFAPGRGTGGHARTVMLPVSSPVEPAAAYPFSSNAYPGDVAIIAAITDCFKVSEETAAAWLKNYPTPF